MNSPQMEQQQQITLESLELQQRRFFLPCLPTTTDEELAVWLLKESDFEIFRAVFEEWVSRHLEC